jgi:hypothetical protein
MNMLLPFSGTKTKSTKQQATNNLLLAHYVLFDSEDWCNVFFEPSVNSDYTTRYRLPENIMNTIWLPLCRANILCSTISRSGVSEILVHSTSLIPGVRDRLTDPCICSGYQFKAFFSSWHGPDIKPVYHCSLQVQQTSGRKKQLVFP